MQTALHIAALVAQIRAELVGGEIVSTEFYKKLRAGYLFVKKGGSKSALGFVYHPAGSGCFCVPAGKINPDTKEKPWPIFGLEGAVLTSVKQPALDRIFELQFRQGEGAGTVVFEVLGPNGNLWLLDADGCRLATLRNRKFILGQPYEPAPIGERLDPNTATPVEIGRRIADGEERSPISRLKDILLGIDDTLAREMIARAGLDGADFGSLSDDELNRLARAANEIAGRFEPSAAGYLYELGHAVETFPFKLTIANQQPEKFKTLSLAVMEMVGRRRDSVGEEDDRKRVLKALERAVKRNTKLLANLTADLATAADYERYKRFAELLQINRDRLKKGLKEIVLEDVLSDPAVEVTVALDPALAPNDNIEEYFRRHRKGREGREILERRVEIASAELERLKRISDDLEKDFESALKRYEIDLASLMPRSSTTTEPTVRLPYRSATLSTGLTIFIGRDGADNDRTTFDFARPYELWFHAQQCPGSHVVMKYPHKNFEPSSREIEETAAIAAWHSKARNDSLVPVVFAERRYVRKPRKAKPGLVTVEREKSLMVTPTMESRDGK
jgi:predicted ribosome quality control (RQC) complex YloA/Tae2 family protein